MDRTTEHSVRTRRLLIETLGVHAVLVAVSVWSWSQPWWWMPVGLAGVWLQRVYFVAHEAVHGKLFPGRRRLNDGVGQLLLLPLALPLRVYRKIHFYHHGHNRRDQQTSALDTFTVRRRSGGRVPWWPWVAWYWLVFGGGWFVHGVVSVLAFLALPLVVARRVSPAFDGWRAIDRRRSCLAVSTGAALHLLTARALGFEVWLAALGAPLVVFALIYSALVYVFHFRTGYGQRVDEHVRSLRVHRVVNWWLLAFQEHAMHHADTSIPWYGLQGGDRNAQHNRLSLLQAVLYQLRGPTLNVYEPR